MFERVQPFAVIEVSDVKDFSWSLKPFIWWMRIIGIELEAEHRTSFWKRSLTILVAGFWLLFDFSIQVTSCAYLQQTINEESDNETTLSVNLTIENANFAVNSIGIHLAILFMLIGRWHQLTAKLQCMEAHLKIDQKQYIKLRYMAVAGLVYIVVVKSIRSALRLCHGLEKTDPNTGVLVVDALLPVTQIFSASIVVLFGLISATISINFQFITSEIDRIFSGQQTQAMITAQLKKLRFYHSLTCAAAEQFQNTFSTIVLLKILYLFVAVINSSFYLLVGIIANEGSTDIAMHSTFMAEHFWQLWIICHAADTNHLHAVNVIKSMRNLQLIGDDQDHQVSQFVQQVYHSLPCFSARDFFYVTKRLFPQLIGSTLTYLIILYQFKLSQKKN